MNDNYFLFHLHTDHSLKDSTTKFKDYIKKAKEVGMKGICFSEHGNVFGWVKKKQECEKNGLKYVFGVECYLTKTIDEKIRDNYHTILMARNFDGVKEILNAISNSTELDHMYYNNRITFDEFLNLSDDVISTSACLGSPLNKLDESDEYYDKLCRKYDYFEIQPHNSEDQKMFNIKLLELSNKYNKPLILGTDTHEISKYKEECRKILRSAKKMNYADEDDFDLSFKTVEEILSMFKDQGCLAEEVYLEAVKNTNKLLENVEEFEIDKSYKYPKFYEKEDEHLQLTTYRMANDKIKKGIIQDSKELWERIDYELSVYKKQGMSSFIAFTGELTQYCWGNNIPIGDGRGSVNGSMIAYILDITDVDAMRWGTNFSRFCNEDRISLGDIDLDFYGEDRPKVYEFIEKKYGYGKTARILTFGTMAEKGTIEEVCRGLKDEFGKRIYDDRDMERIKVEFDDDCVDGDKYKYPSDNLRKKYSDLFYYYDGLVGTVIRTGFHPAGMVGSPVNLRENIGLKYDKENDIYITQCDMKEIDSLNYVKYDILGLRNIGILKGVREMLGEKYKKSYEIDWNDKTVWDDMKKSPVGIFQMESQSAFEALSNYNTESIDDMSFVNSLIRPSCESFRDKAIKRIKNDLPNKDLERILGNTMCYLTFQEQILEFLHEFCGYTMSQADGVRRAIGKKQPEVIAELLPEIRSGYIENRDIAPELASREFDEFYKVIDDASNYGFSRNHSTPYSMIGFRCAMDRVYHTPEFIASYINTATSMDDIRAGTSLAELYGIKINEVTVGKSEAKYWVKDGEIYKGMKSIAFINDKIPNEINSLDLDREPYEVLGDIIANTSCDSRQISILAKIGYFERYGKRKKIQNFIDRYSLITKNSGKEFAKDKAPDWLVSIITENKEVLKNKVQKRIGKDKITDDMILIKDSPKKPLMEFVEERVVYKNCRETDKKYVDCNTNYLIKRAWETLCDEDFSTFEKIKFDYEFLGYCNTNYSNKDYKIGFVDFSGISKKGNRGIYTTNQKTKNEFWFNAEDKFELPKKESIILVSGAIEKGKKWFITKWEYIKE